MSLAVGLYIGFQGGNSTRFSELACSEKKASTTTEAPKAQPWKAHWSPREDAAGKGDTQYTVGNAGEPIVDGLSCDVAGNQYIASSTGDAVVDGVEGGSRTRFAELACSAKQPLAATENPKAQPWKAHWYSKKNALLKADNQYVVSSTGEVLVDGIESGVGNQYITSSTGDVVVDGL